MAVNKHSQRRIAMATPVRHLAGPVARHLTADLDFSTSVLEHTLQLSAQVKRSPARYSKKLAGRYLSLLFEKPSLRTRLTFELAIKQLGGDAVLQQRPHRRSASPSRTSRAIWIAGRTPSSRASSRRPPSMNWRTGPRSRHQRPERPVSSLPGAGRRADAEGTLRRSARASNWPSSAMATMSRIR